MNFQNILLLFKNKRFFRKVLKLLKASLKDLIFWLILADYVLTMYIIKFGYGLEANPLVLKLGNTPALLISLFIYFVCIPKKNLGFVRIILIAYYSFIIAHHFIVIYG